MTIDIDEIERIAKAGDPWGYAATSANVLALIAEVRRMRALLDNRPALNAGLAEAYTQWTAGVYESDGTGMGRETQQ